MSDVENYTNPLGGASRVVAPIHTGTVNSHEVRFFKGRSGQPEFPWCALGDLKIALGLSSEARRLFLRLLQRDWSKALRTVATPDGVVTIAPHFVAQSTLQAFVEAGLAPASVEKEYHRASYAAIRLLMGDRPPMARLEYYLAAFDAAGGE